MTYESDTDYPDDEWYQWFEDYQEPDYFFLDYEEEYEQEKG